MNKEFLENADLWFEHAESIKQTDELLAFFTETFSHENLTHDFIEQAGMMDMFFILSDHLIGEKRFNDYINLRNILKTQQKDIYEKEFIFFDETILRYALFIGDDLLVKDAFQQFVGNPDRDIDVYLPLLRLLALYGKGDWVEDICDKNYDIINGGSYVGAPGLELAKYVMCHRLEVEYLKFKETGNFNSESYFNRLKRFQLDKFKAKNKAELIDALIKPIADAQTLKKAYDTDKHYTKMLLANSFMRYAYEEKGMPFIVSGVIWELMSDYWHEDDVLKAPFHLDEKSFDKYAMSLMGFFNHYFCNTIAVVLGATYVYDFLKQIELITENEHKKAVKDIGKLSGAIQNLGERLWKNGFFQSWQIADSVDLLQFQTLIENTDISFTSVQEVEYKSHNEHYGLDNIDEKLNKAIKERFKKLEPNYVPVRTEPKIGRNDPCTCGSGKKYKKCCG
jgi:SEC-C motif